MDAVYVCPHHPEERCKCRKPKPALIFQAAREMGITLQLSYVVGDDAKDMEAGKAAECKTVLVTTGPNQGNIEGQGKPPDYVASDLYKAAEWIIENAKLRIVQAKGK